MNATTRVAATVITAAAALTLAACSRSSSGSAASSASSTAPSTSSSAAAASSGSAAMTSAASSSAMSSAAMSSSGAASSAPGSSASGSAMATLAANAGAGKKIVYIPGLTGVAFYSSVSCGAASEAKRLGASFDTQGDATFAVDKQTAVLNAVVATKPDAIMISITDPKAMVAPLLKAKNAGIKIIGIDGDLDDKTVMSTNIQSDNLKGGALAAGRLGDVMGGKGTVVTVDNAAGSIISDDRFNGFKTEMTAKYPNIKVLGRQFSANSTDKAASIVKASVANDPTISGVYALETANTQGAATGVQQSGKKGSVHIVGYDTSDPIIAAIKAGSVDGTVAQYPLGEGVTGVDSAITLINGGTVPRDQGEPFFMVTPANVSSAQAQKFIYKTTC
jgi:ribose transport system substrate-binding protein